VGSETPRDLSCEILGEFLNQPRLDVEAEHKVAVLPHLFGFGVDRIVVQ
jgi:hypothetical protein